MNFLHICRRRLPRQLLWGSRIIPLHAETTCVNSSLQKYGVGVAAGFASKAKSAKNEPELLQDCGVMGSYANALFLAAHAKGSLDGVMSDLSFIVEAVEQCPDFAIFISTPGLRTVEKIKFLKNDEKDPTIPRMQPETLNCLEMLMEQKRISQLQQLFKHFETLYLSSKGQIKCDVVSAHDITDAQKKSLVQALKKRLGNKEPIIHYRQNPAILGGLVVKIGEQIIDASVATKIERMQTQLCGS